MTTKVDPARRVAFEVLRAVSERDAYANLVLPAALRAAGLSGRDAAFSTELTYGTLRGRGSYDAVLAECVDRPLDRLDPPVLDALRLGAHQLLALRVPAHAAVSQTVALVRTEIGPATTGLINAVLRRVAGDPLERWLTRVAPRQDADPTGHRAVVASHPRWVVDALDAALAADRGADDADLDALLRSHNLPPAVTLVARPGLCTADELATATGGAPGRWSPNAVLMPAGDPGALAAVREGRAGVQDEGSQLAVLALTSVAADGLDARWLDLCAGPGGKAALLGAIARSREARVVAVEVSAHRAELVRRTTALLAAAVEVRTGDGRQVGGSEPGAYDRVLVDAPCTGLGALRRRPEARWRRTPDDVSALVVLQRELLDSALNATRPGGVVAYCTCSPLPAETTEQVDRLLADRSDVEPLDARASLDDIAGLRETLPDRPTVQLWPHVHGTDAIFLALLRRG